MDPAYAENEIRCAPTEPAPSVGAPGRGCQGGDVAPIALLPLDSCIAGKYVIKGVLGHGGSAVVYDAVHLGLGRRVAFKLYPLPPQAPPELAARFKLEARTLALLRHENILEIYDSGTLADGSPYLVVQRIRGENLAARLKWGRLPLGQIIELARQLLRALCALEQAGIVHRDIKPENLMVEQREDGTELLKLVDFGVAKCFGVPRDPHITCPGGLVGTPQYMAPEQLRAEVVDARTDLYAAGAVIYQMLTGRAPYRAASFAELVTAVLHGSIEPIQKLRPQCPRQLQRIVLQALSRERSARFDSASAMLQALERVREDELQVAAEAGLLARDSANLTVPAARARPRPVRGPSLRRHMSLVGFAVAGAVAGFALVHQVRSFPERQAQVAAAVLAPNTPSPVVAAGHDPTQVEARPRTRERSEVAPPQAGSEPLAQSVHAHALEVVAAIDEALGLRTVDDPSSDPTQAPVVRLE